MRKSLSVSALAACLLLPGALAAGQAHKVSQAGKQFAPGGLEVRRGDTVVFVNDDAITHNVFARGGAKDFNTGALKPGDSREIAFDAPGTVDVKCAIHPLMKMTVTVR